MNTIPAVTGGGRLPIAFVHIQKTAGTSLKFILRNSFGVRHCDVNAIDPAPGTPFAAGDLAFLKSVHPGIRSISGHEIIEPTRYLAGVVLPYTILREPLARSISHFQHKVATGRITPDLDRFLDDPANHNVQVRRIAGGEDLEKAKHLLREAYFFVGLAERFDASMKLFRSLCPYPIDLRCQHKNVVGRTALGRSLQADPRGLAKLREANRLDRQLWEFVNQTLFPEAAERSGADISGRLPQFPRSRVPWRFHLSRLRHRLLYRTRLKRARSRRRAQA